MIKFVIVEDDEKIQNVIKKVIRKISIYNDEEVEVRYFTRYNKELQKEINEELYHKVYILDIELDGSVSGIDIGHKIRSIEWDSEIIFITNHDKMFETVHRTILDVFDFIEKFHDLENRLEKDIKLIYSQKFDKKMLKISGRNAELEIYLKNILYITRDKEDRKIIIHTKDIEFKVISTLNEILEKLDNRFVRTHRGCIANKDYVVEYRYNKGYFVLKDGTIVDLLSKKYRKEIEKKDE